ncbi:uncharacterized protein LOC109793651 [Cajanus cajan]|uniref:uncharacterized protein LOC109793651 n=1 Tax=Cajanus cajan TaxID=3821 RepID=UPI00098DB347|nr:uncharacterized protein LOC109793651 [Cajanus cajan]
MQRPDLYDRQSKLEETLNQFMQVSISNHENTEASIKNLEIQMGQLAKQLAENSGGNFSANTHTNPKENCSAITTRGGKRVGVLEDEEEQQENKVEETEREPASKRIEMKSKVSSTKDIPYPPAPSKKDKEKQFARFMELFKKLQINIPFSEALEQMPTYAKFMKDLLTKKRKFIEQEIIELEAGCNAIIQKNLPPKLWDPESFTIPITIGDLSVGRALLDLGASINLMPLSMLDRVGQVVVKLTCMTLQLADRSIKYPYGVIENMLVKVDKFIFPADFVVMDMEEDYVIPIILGRSFMKTAREIIDIENGEFKLRVHDEVITFNVFEAMTHLNDKGACFRMDVQDEVVLEATQQLKKSFSLEYVLTDTMDELDEEDVIEMSECLQHLNTFKEIPPSDANHEELKGDSTLVSTKPELKILPIHLKYVFLEPNGEKPIIISNSLSQLEEQKLIKVLQVHKEAIGWSISNLKGINPAYYMHKINMESDYRPVAQA